MKALLIIGLLACIPSAGAENRNKIGEAGKFDYYLMTMSWSPAYCAGKTANPKDPQCGVGRQFAFVLHGLWPQYNQRVQGSGWPQFCSDAPGLKNPKALLDIMPSNTLISHEWDKHGTCSGLDPDGYFALARKALLSVKTPPRFQSPKEYFTISPADVKKEFLSANPGLSPLSISIQCSANFLSEVRVCMDRNLKPVPCTDRRECRAPSVRVPPVR